MRRPFASVTVLATLIGALHGGCRHPARTTPTPTEPAEGYCWWAVFRTPLPPDTVAARFAQAFTSLGLTGATWSHRADTALAHAGPTVLDGPRGGGTYAARVVAYRHGDTTRFRHFVAITPPPRGWAPPADRVRPAGRHISFCGEIGRAAQTHGTAPREPNGEEKLDVWQRRP